MSSRRRWRALVAFTTTLLVLGTGCGEVAQRSDGGVGDAGDRWREDGGSDAGPGDAGPADAGVDAGPVDAGPPPPRSVFFVGNSFTFGGPVPDLVRDLATYAGFEEPDVDYRAIGGQTLEGHRADSAPEGAPARVAEGWDAVVLQELSTRPTDQIGPAEQFKEDATWFYDLAKDANPVCEVVLYETWARRFNHGLYPGTFSDPAQMQAELRFHYNDAADRYIPEHSRSTRNADVRVAPVGDAWEVQLAMGEPPRLHAGDDYHAGPAGQYLNALVLYSTLFRRRADGLVPLNGLSEAVAIQLQASADSVTGATGFGPSIRPLAMSVADAIEVDFGPLWVDGWHALPVTNATVFDLSTSAGAPSAVRVTAWGFSGVQEGGLADNDLGLPPDVARDTLWIGSFDGHAAALEMEARLVIRGLPPGRYDLELFASRTGDDEGRGRLTRYRIGDDYVDLEVSNNTGRVATLTGVRPDARGEVVIRVGVSPEGAGRFAYAGLLRVVRAGD